MSWGVQVARFDHQMEIPRKPLTWWFIDSTHLAKKVRAELATRTFARSRSHDRHWVARDWPPLTKVGPPARQTLIE
jgi:hypothetical protein